MAWNISERFPSWGEAGEFPAAGFFYEGGDQVNEKHLDALWNGVNGLEEDVQAALNDIDSNADGVVDKAEAGAAGFDLDGDLLAAGGEVIWDESANYIPQPRLQNDDVTFNAGDGLTGGGTVNLGGSSTLDINVSDFAGAGLQDDASNNLELVNDTITASAGDGLKGGGLTSLGGSFTFNIEPNDFAGSGLQDDGADNLELINDSVTVAGNPVSLGGSTGIALGDLSNVTASGEGSGGGFDADTVDGNDAADLKDDLGWTYIASYGPSANLDFSVPEYDEYKIYIYGDVDAFLELNFNSAFVTFEYRRADGDVDSGRRELIDFSNSAFDGWLTLTQVNSQIGFTWEDQLGDPSASDMQSGITTDFSSINSIQLDTDTNGSLQANVYGRNVP